MRLFKSDWVDRVLQVLKIPDDVPIENKRVTGAIANAQGQVEAQNFDSRKNVLKYDDVMDRQRHVIYGERREVLEGADLEEQIRDVHRRRRRRASSPARPRASPRSGTSTRCWTAAQAALAGRRSTISAMAEEVGGVDGLDRDELIEALQAGRPGGLRRAARRRSAPRSMRELERRVVLSVLDRKWREHLYEMDYLREGIGLRGYSQRDPLVEYQREGFDMFTAMMDGIKEESVGFLFNLEVQLIEDDEQEQGFVEEEVEEPLRRELRSEEQPTGRARPPAADHGQGSRPSEDAAAAGLLRAVRGRHGPRRAGRVRRRRRAAAPGRPYGDQRRRRVRRRGAQRAVPVRLGQEVQAVPRRARVARPG